MIIAPLITRAQEFYFLIGLIHESTEKTITLDVKNYTNRVIAVDPRLSVYFGSDSVWLNGPNRIISFVPNETERITFSTSDARVDMSKFKELYVSVLYSISPFFQISPSPIVGAPPIVVATKPIDGQYIRLDLPLPVQMISFKSRKEGVHNLLQWITASEKDSEKFEVERSLDGKNFKKIGEVRSVGTMNIVSNYEFKDYYPEASVVYYRLKQIDFNGEFEYSKMIAAIGATGGRYLGFDLQAGEVPVGVKYFNMEGKLLSEDEAPTGFSILVLTTNIKKHSRKQIR